MGFYALTGLINALTSIVVGLIAYFGYRKSIIAKRFALFCGGLTVWSFAYFFWQIATTENAAFFWYRLAMAGAIFIPVLFLHFVLTFIDKIEKYKKLLIFGYPIFLFFLVTNFRSRAFQLGNNFLALPLWPTS